MACSTVLGPPTVRCPYATSSSGDENSILSTTMITATITMTAAEQPRQKPRRPARFATPAASRSASSSLSVSCSVAWSSMLCAVSVLRTHAYGLPGPSTSHR